MPHLNVFLLFGAERCNSGGVGSLYSKPGTSLRRGHLVWQMLGVGGCMMIGWHVDYMCLSPCRSCAVFFLTLPVE